jgi:hypothetical protein
MESKKELDDMTQEELKTEVHRLREKYEDAATETDGDTEYFYEESALAQLLASSEVFPFQGKLADSSTTVGVAFCCNDVFAWASADAETISTIDELKEIYKAWKSGGWGTTKWACKKRGERPQPPVEKQMREAGEWDEAMEALPLNRTDKETQAMFAQAAAKQKAKKANQVGEKL